MGHLQEDQFSDTVKERHAHNVLFSADEIDSMSDDQYQAVISDVAIMQRGPAESAMNRAQVTFGGGLRGHSMEHIGDLPHRMQEQGGVFGREFVRPKVDTQIDSLSHPYGYEREVNEQSASNKRLWEKKGKPVPTPEEEHAAERDYVLEHHNLPVYNEPAFHAKGAAVHLGLRNYDKALSHLQTIQSWSDDEYKHKMSRQGSVEWLRSQEIG